MVTSALLLCGSGAIQMADLRAFLVSGDLHLYDNVRAEEEKERLVQQTLHPLAQKLTEIEGHIK